MEKLNLREKWNWWKCELKNFQNHWLWNYFAESLARSIQPHQQSKQLDKTPPKTKGNGSLQKKWIEVNGSYVHGSLTKDLHLKRRNKCMISSVLFSIRSYLRYLLLRPCKIDSETFFGIFFVSVLYDCISVTYIGGCDRFW